MESPEHVLERGVRVRTNSLSDTVEYIVKPQYLERRVPNAEGIIVDWVPGHGGDVYWVFHGESLKNLKEEDIAAYCYTEFEFSE